MWSRALIFAVAMSLCVHPAAHAQGIVYEVFGAYLDALRQQAGIPGLSATIVDANSVAWERSYGAQDIGRNIAARPDTPFNADGLTQVFTAAMLLQCAEQRRLSIDESIGSFRGVNTSEPDATIRQLLSHTTGTINALSFAFRPERLAPLWPIVRACTQNSYRETLATFLVERGMLESVPGANIVNLVPPAEGIPEPEDAARYAAVLRRRPLPYTVDDRGHASAGAYPPSSANLTASSGLITTVRDLAKFDLALKQGDVLEAGTLAAALTAPAGASGALPHGLGWFVQTYGGEPVAWQFGVGENTSSSLMIMLPSRGLTFIAMANSDRLVRPFPLEAGDVSVSPFAKLFFSLFVR
jgi:CubicO group peptidase (beta-lactamase class C family)